MDFLRRNFGVEGPAGLTLQEADARDVLLQMALDSYCRAARLGALLQHTLQALDELALATGASAQARLRYVGLVLRSLVEDGRLPPITVLFVADRLLAVANRTRSHTSPSRCLG